jgi:type IV secretory pathway protease TraF
MSFDSRYFGPVPLAAVRSYLRPVWTAGPER